MTRQRYFPTANAEQIGWLNNFANKLQGHAPTLGIDPAVCAAGIAEARWAAYLLGDWLANEKAHAKAATQTLADALYGTGQGPFVLPPHSPAPFPGAIPGAVPPLPAVVPMPAGSLNRIFTLVQDIKNKPAYNQTIGMDLGIIGSEKQGPDLNTVQPSIKAIVAGGVVQIDWNFGGFADFLDLIEIQVDRGNGWTLLTYDTTPGYTDSTPMPAASTKWKYRAIYRVGDHQVGQWSLEISVTVG